jgi:hypothetical protein
MKQIFTATILEDDRVDANGIQVPGEIIAILGKGKRPAVSVSLAGYTCRTTVAVMGVNSYSP